MDKNYFSLLPGQKIFEGEYRQKMFELRREGYSPWSTEDFIEIRNAVSLRHPFWHYNFDTDFGIAGTKRKIYVTPHSPRLRNIMPYTKLTFFGISMKACDLARAKIYYRADLILNRDLIEEEARQHPIWLSLVKENQEQLDKYVEHLFRFGWDKLDSKTMMGIYIPEEIRPVEKPAVVGRLTSRGHIYGNSLDLHARLIGMRQGMPELSTEEGRQHPPATAEQNLAADGI